MLPVLFDNQKNMKPLAFTFFDLGRPREVSLNVDQLQMHLLRYLLNLNDFVSAFPYETQNSESKTSKFSFNVKDIDYVNEKQSKDLPLLQKFDYSSKNRVLIRHLSGSDEKLYTEVSEGWNPLSPLSIEGETEAERLLSSRCGSHASGSARTVDSMTNVTRMTISSLDLSNSTSSSDSFSSVSSVNGSLSSDETEEDYQHQWNVLWKKHYDEEYLQQYQQFIKSILESTNPGK